MTFAAGDVVALKSGSQPMTVVAVENEQAECIWAGEDGDLMRETVPTVVLEEVEVLWDEDETADEEEAEAARTEKELSPA